MWKSLKSVVWERVKFLSLDIDLQLYSSLVQLVKKQISKDLTLYQTIPTFNDPNRETFEYIVGKGENAAFSPFPTVFSTLPNFSATFDCRLQLLSVWTSLKICPLVMS